MNGNRSARLSAITDPSFFAQPPWTTESPEWLVLDDQIGPDHPVRLFARLVEEELNLEDLQCSYSRRGTRPHRPDLLLKLLIYEHSQGRPQPRQWFADRDDSKAVQWLTFGMQPSQTTLYEFRDRVQPWLANLNHQVIRTAIAEGHTAASSGALDGTYVAANASRHRLVNLDTVQKRLVILDQEIAQAERQQQTPASEACPPTIEATSASEAAENCNTLAWKAKTLRGQKCQRGHYRRARDVLMAKHAANTRRRKDKRKKGEQVRVALGDPEAPLGLDKQKTYRPLYNVQTMSDVLTDLVLAYATVPTVSDSGQLLGMIDRTRESTQRQLEEVLVDSGYPSGEELAECRQRNVCVLSPWNENSFTQEKRAASAEKGQIPKDRFTFDAESKCYRCPEGKDLSYCKKKQKQKAKGDYVTLSMYRAEASDCGSCPQKARCVVGKSGVRTVQRQEHEEEIEELKERMKSTEAKEKYGKRCCTVERRFADMKTHRGLGRLSGQTPERADAQVGLSVLAHNLRTLEKLRHRNPQHVENAGKMCT